MNIPFIEIIEEITPDPNLLMWKFSDEDKEIKNGAKLTIRESQVAVFLNEGKLADVFLPGLHKLSTENIPILTALKNWKHGFDSPFKADIYFFNSRNFVNNKWGTPAPILMRDPEFGQVRVRAFGTFDIKIQDYQTFFSQYAGNYPRFNIFELQYELRYFIAPQFGEVLANENISVKDIAGNINIISKKVEPLLKPYFAQLGIELVAFNISSVTLPDEVSAFYDKITNMNMVSDMNKFTKFQTANAIGNANNPIHDAAQNAIITGMMINQMQNLNNQDQVQSINIEDITEKLKKLKSLFEADLINEEEYKIKKTDLMNKL